MVELVFILSGGAGVRRGQVSVDGRWNAAAVLVVIGQRQVQEAGASGKVDVLNVLHLGPTHGTQLRRRKEGKKNSQQQVFEHELLTGRSYRVEHTYGDTHTDRM